MRCTLTQQTINEEIAKARALLEADALFSAAVRLGILESASVPLADSERERIRELLASVDSETLVEQSMDKADRLRRILAHGARFESEELVLALTLRVEIAAALRCAVAFAQDSVLNVDLSDCDEALVKIANSSPNRNAYRKAISLIEKNWRSRMPFSPQSLGIPSSVGLIDS
jgi:hypothetical protein